METDERELDAIIVQNIGDLEASINRTKERIDARLNEEAWKVLKHALGQEEWHFEEFGDFDNWFAPRSWLTADDAGDDDADPWFRFGPLDTPRELGTWTGRYLSAKNNRQKMAFIFCWDRFYVDDYKAAASEAAEELKQINHLGFHQDGRDIYLPLSFESNLMADGFRDNDLRFALEPIVRAVTVLKATKKHFDALRLAMLKHAR